MLKFIMFSLLSTKFSVFDKILLKMMFLNFSKLFENDYFLILICKEMSKLSLIF